MANARKTALRALLKVHESAYSNITLNKVLNEDNLQGADRALATAIFYGVLDRTITLDYVLSNHIKTSLKKVAPFALENLRVALYQIMYMDSIPDSAAVNEAVKLIKASKCKHLSGFVNGVLRNILRSEIMLPDSNDTKSLSIKYSCPEWVIKSFKRDYGIDDTISLLDASLQNPAVTLRVNTLKTTPDKLLNLLTQEGVTAKQIDFDDALEIVGGISVSNNACYKEGLFHIQDLASQTAVKILNPTEDEAVLDICAAPGGKSFTMAEYMNNTGSIVACDLYDSRVQLIKSGAERLGINNIESIKNDATVFNDDFGMFDAILCDVPCSGLGVIRRKPEIKYKNINEYSDITAIQSKILETTAKYLKPNGRIMYSTCTLRKCENEAIVNGFLDKHSDYRVKYQHTFMPHRDGTDGFYCALLQKAGD
ncbi:MAG: 16S rRNA (cytosine(967)-C(5))-methyltransferase RsmB [Clostridia bacterium]|nr:16S rRNA (cytosine(967)-C(5))-methyltransferase RsmB [Clostridia bacterium]